MVENLSDSTLGAESVIRLLVEQAGDKVHAVLTHRNLMTLRIGEVNGLLFNKFVHLGVAVITCVEGRETNDHFIGEDADSPPIDREGVSRVLQNLGSKIIGSSTERERLCVWLQNFRETEISQANVTIFVHEDVLGLEITVDDLFIVQSADGHADLDSVEPGTVFREALGLAQVHKELSSPDKPHDKEDLGVSLEHIAHSD